MTTSIALTLASAVHYGEGAEVMLYRILSVSAIALCLILAYFLWRSHTYNKVMGEKYDRLLTTTARRSEALPTPDAVGRGPVGGDLQSPPLQSQAIGGDLQSPTAEQQIFLHLCQLMDTPESIFTDPELNRCRLAQLLGTNEHYVSDAVSACTNGGSITDFLNGYRLRHAMRLLATTDDPIGLIAELSGFSRRSFYRVFDEEYHTSPSEYRKAMRKA